MTEKTVPAKVIKEDHRLAKAVESLAQLRWHWTLDESNPKGMYEFQAYAEAVGRAENTIRKYAKAWDMWLKSEHAACSDLSDFDEYLERAMMSQEQQIATEAVAKQLGIGFRTASRQHRDKISRVRASAETQEKHGTDFTQAAKDSAERVVFIDEIHEAKENPKTPKEIAEAVVSAAEHEVIEARVRQEPTYNRVTELESLIDEASKSLEKALKLASEIHWRDDQRRWFIEDVKNQIQTLIDLIIQALKDPDGMEKLERMLNDED